jgi:hypothetical protein
MGSSKNSIIFFLKPCLLAGKLIPVSPEGKGLVEIEFLEPL